MLPCVWHLLISTCAAVRQAAVQLNTTGCQSTAVGRSVFAMRNCRLSEHDALQELAQLYRDVIPSFEQATMPCQPSGMHQTHDYTAPTPISLHVVQFPALGFACSHTHFVTLHAFYNFVDCITVCLKQFAYRWQSITSCSGSRCSCMGM